MKLAKVFLILFSILKEGRSSNSQNDTKLGFLVKYKTLKTAGQTKLQKVRLLAKIGFSLDDATAELMPANTELAKLKTMKLISEENDEGRYIKRHVNFIIKEHERIITELAMLYSYSKEGIEKGDTYVCEQTVPGISKDFIKAFSSDITTTIKFMDMTRSKAQMITVDEGDSEYELLVINIFRLREILSDFRKTVKDYVYLLDNLTANRLTPDVLWYLQQTTCVEDFEEERYEIESCKKMKLGVECNIHITVFKNLKTMQQYLPISYNEYQLSVPEKAILVKDGNDQWSALQCDEEILENEIVNLGRCKFIHDMDECLKMTELNAFERIKEECSFEQKTPKAILQTEDGILVQSNALKVREKEEQNKFTMLGKIVPYLIKTNNPLSVIQDESEDIYEPRKREETRQIVYTKLTEKQIKSLPISQVMQKFYVSYLYEHYNTTIVISITIIVFISISLFCSWKWKNIQEYFIRLSSDRENSRRRNQNYRLNRILLKSATSTPTHL